MKSIPWKLWEGQVVDSSFPLRRYLGGTEQSAVYLTQYGDTEPVNAAIKLVLETGESDLAFQWERASKLSHPNLLRLFHTGSWQVNQLSLRYAVTEYAEENLADVLADRPLTPAEVREVLGPLVEALAYIHGEGLVFGRLKPANIMAAGDVLKLPVDGVEMVGELNVVWTAPGPYDPPEFCERGHSPVGDVWSFGITLVEVLTQRRPVMPGPKQEPVLPEDLPAEFVPMARACLQIDPRRRASLAEILKQLQPEAAMAAETFVEPASLKKRWWALAAVGAVVVAMAGALVGPTFRKPSVPVPPEQKETAMAAAPASSDSGTVQAAGPAPGGSALGTVSADRVRAADPPAKERTKPAGPAVKFADGDAKVLHEVLPTITDAARRSIRGKFQIQVHANVEASGHVTGVELESKGNRYFSNLTLQAVRQWQFQPAADASEWRLRFEFSTSGVVVQSLRAEPPAKQ